MMSRYGITFFVIISLCNDTIFASSTPTMSRIYGDQYTPEVPYTQSAGTIGQLVPTGIFGTNGSLSLAAQVPNAQAVGITVLDTGMLVVALQDGTNSYLVQYLEEGLVNTDFATTTGNILTIPGKPNVIPTILVDKQGRFIVAGSGSPTPWMVRVTPDGQIDSTFNFTDGASWTSSGSINQMSFQTSGKIIVLGFNGTNGMIARYDLDGSIDSHAFGNNGYVILNGSSFYPTVTVPLQTIVIDESNALFIAYINVTSGVFVSKFSLDGLVDISWNGGNPAAMTYLNGTSLQSSQLQMVLTSLQDLVVAIPSGGSPQVIKAASIQMTTGGLGSFANFVTTGGVFGTDSYQLFNIITTNKGKVYFVGSDLTSKKMTVITTTNRGILATDFNAQSTPGVNFFYPTGVQPSVYAHINSIGLAPNGQLFTAGAQLDSGITTPYLSSLYSFEYDTLVTQYPQAHEQGTRDLDFGSQLTENYQGVMTPYYGLYRDQSQQKGQAVLELISGKILMGESGYIGTGNYINMILVRMSSSGELDSTFGLSGKLLLPNLTTSNEVVTGLLEDSDGNLYVCGYSDVGAIFRKYTNNGLLLWNADYNVTGFQAYNLLFKSGNNILLFLSGPGSTGQINAYSITDGSFNTAFHSSGTTPGILESTAFGLNMGPLYSATIGEFDNIVVGYKDTVTNLIDVVEIASSGNAVIWENLDVFLTTSINADNLRIAINKDGNIVTAAGWAGNFVVTILDGTNGNPTADFTTPLLIPVGFVVQVSQVMGISDDSVMISGYDTFDPSMILVRILSTGVLDTSFNTQGINPGIVVLQIGHEVTDYYARVLSSMTLQSVRGVNQGNIIAVGYEQMFSSMATPMSYRVFGTPGTTQVKYFPTPAYIPGTPDITYNGTGVAETYVQGASTPAANQEVRTIGQLSNTQIMTIVVDNTTSIAYTQRLNQDSSPDSSYGSGLGIAIAKMDGVETVESMVINGPESLLVTGSNATYGGYVKKILPSGIMDTRFGGPTGTAASANYPLGTAYGIMDVVNGCQEMTNGNIVVVGSLGGVGTVQLLSRSGAIIAAFGNGGMYQVGNNITSVSVDVNNYIYAAVAYTSSSQLIGGIVKLNSSGQVDVGYGFNGFINSAISQLDSIETLRSAYDADNRMVVAGSYGGSSGLLVVNRFTTDGLQDTTFNSGSQLEISLYVPGNIIVTDLITLRDNRILVSGYQYDTTDSSNDYEFIVCVDSLGQLDGNFGDQAINGIVTFQGLNSSQILRKVVDMGVQSNGKILLSGGEIPAVDEETPLTFRFNGYVNIQAISQSSGYLLSLPNKLNHYFNGTGINHTATIELSERNIGMMKSNIRTLGEPIPGDVLGGSVVSDRYGRVLVAGVTSNDTFIVVRFLPNGSIDRDFGDNGVAISSVYLNTLSGGHIAFDIDGNIYAGGMTAIGQMTVCKFDTDGQIVTGFGVNGTAVSTMIDYILSGGYVAVNLDYQPILAGYTSQGDLIACKFLENGSIDTTFGIAPNYIASIPVLTLVEGGNVIVDALGNIFIGGRTYDEVMIVACLTPNGDINSSYGTMGIASTDVISGLTDGGRIAINNNSQISIGGLTDLQAFVVAQFTPAGVLDTNFNTTGMAYSLSINVLNRFGSIATDNINNIVLAGVARTFEGGDAMIVARFTPEGSLDLTFSSVGMATSDAIEGFVSGAYVTTDIYNNVVLGGILDTPALLVAEMYSGLEKVVTDLSSLNNVDLPTYYYGYNFDYLKTVVSLDFLMNTIGDRNVRQIVKNACLGILQDYYDTYIPNAPQQQWNLVWNVFTQQQKYDVLRDSLNHTYPHAQSDITAAFEKLRRRFLGMRYSSL